MKHIKLFENCQIDSQIKKLLDYKSDYTNIVLNSSSANLAIEQLSDGEISIYIDEIHSDIKNQGDGKKLMQELINFSNKNNIPLSLRASINNNIKDSNKDSGLSQDDLIKWYLKLGFKISEEDNNFETDDSAPFMVYKN